jgi:hypothetical protein
VLLTLLKSFCKANNLSRFFLVIILTGIVLHLTFILISAISTVLYPYQTHQFGEWESLYQSILISQGANPYVVGDKTFATAIPYHFIYPLLCALPVKLFGPDFWIGRSISIAMYGFILLLMYWILRKHFKLSYSFVFLGLILSLVVQNATGYSLFKFHPNALCVALGLLSLLMAPPGYRPVRYWIPALLVAIVCFYVKQTGVFFLATLLIVMLARHRYNAIIMALAAVVATFAIGLTAYFLMGKDYIFFCYILPSGFQFDWSRLNEGVYFLFCFSFLFTLPSLPLLIRIRALFDPFMLATILSIVFSVYSFAIWGGTETNFVFCLFLLSITTARAAAIFMRRKQKLPVIAILIAELALIGQLWGPFHKGNIPGKSDEAAARHILDLMSKSDETVLALDEQQMAYLAGKPIYTSANTMDQFRQAGIESYPRIEQMITLQQFDMVAINGLRLTIYEERTIRLFHLLREYYCVDEIIRSNSFSSPMFIMRPWTDTDNSTKHSLLGLNESNVNDSDSSFFVRFCKK